MLFLLGIPCAGSACSSSSKACPVQPCTPPFFFGDGKGGGRRAETHGYGPALAFTCAIDVLSALDTSSFAAERARGFWRHPLAYRIV